MVISHLPLFSYSQIPSREVYTWIVVDFPPSRGPAMCRLYLSLCLREHLHLAGEILLPESVITHHHSTPTSPPPHGGKRLEGPGSVLTQSVLNRHLLQPTDTELQPLWDSKCAWGILSPLPFYSLTANPRCLHISPAPAAVGSYVPALCCTR